MTYRNHWHFGCKLTAAALLAFGILSGSAYAQSDNAPSVAEAARRAREQKKAAAKPARTLTNDDLPAAPAAAAQPPVTADASAEDSKTAGAVPEGAVPDAAKAPAPAPAAGDAETQKKADKEAALKQAKAALAQAMDELDVLQRKAALDSESYYSRTGYAQDAQGKAKLDVEAEQISDKKNQVEGLQARVAELQAQLDEGAAPPKPEPPR